MIARSFVQIDGPPGSGKTSLCEHLLRSNRNLLLAVLRTEDDPAIDALRETGPAKDPELRRLLDAGASRAARLRCPPDDADAIWTSDALQDYSQGVLIEGPLHREFPAVLRIFVTRPPPPGQRLAAKRPRKPASPDASISISILDGLLSQTPALDPAFAGAATADLLVLNVHDPDQRARATKAATEFLALPRAPFSHRKRTARIVDLADPRDAELKRVLDTIKRALRSAD